MCGLPFETMFEFTEELPPKKCLVLSYLKISIELSVIYAVEVCSQSL